MEFLHFFLSEQFIPCSHCHLGQPGLVSLHVISNLVIALAYYSVSVMLVYFVRTKPEVSFNRMLLMFGVFVVACGTTHVMEVWTLWHPVYWISGLLKAITAFLSVFTAIELILLLPLALDLPSPAQLEAANVALLTEVSERKRTEDKLCKILDFTEQQRILDVRQKQVEQEQLVAQLERLNAVKDNFLNTVSHELRTPLCNIMMAVQILQSISTDDQTQRYLEILQAECDRELNLVNDLLDLQRVEAATTPLVTPEPLLLEYWLHSITEPFFIRAQERQQTLQLDIQPGVPPLVSDNTSLARIFTELLNNACKYTPIGGKIVLSVCYKKPVSHWLQNQMPDSYAVRHSYRTGSTDTCYPAETHREGVYKPENRMPDDLTEVPPGDHWLSKTAAPTELAPQNSVLANAPDSSSPNPYTIFTISNSVEIPQAALPRIFDKFYRVSKSDDYKQNGSGLGLALVEKLVEQLQGTIQVESNAGWTTFTLKFKDLALST